MKRAKRGVSLFLTLLLMFSVASPSLMVAHAISNEQAIFNFLTQDMGLNTAAACGVLANIEKESNFRNDVLEYGYTWASGGGYGICQWTNSPRTSSSGRRTNLVNWCNNNGYDYTSLNGQLHYLQYELNTSYYYNLVTKKLINASNNADGAYTAGYYWCYYFEVPAGYNTGVSETRGNLAKNTYWPKYGGVVPDTLTEDSRYPTPFKCRIISSTKVQCYNDAYKSTSPGYIYPEDDCVVTAIYTNGMLKCDCPWSDGSTKTVYIDKTAFINSSSSPSNMTAPQKANTYLRTDKATNIGWIDPGDSITKVATSGSMTQIIYPASVGKRCAWVDTSALVPLSTSWKVPFNCYIIPTEKTRCYNDAALSDSPGFIYVDDDCIINAVTSNGVVQCLCPWSDGTTKTVYVDSSVFFVSASTPVQMTAPKYAVTYLRTSDTSASWGWIDPGDTIYKVGTSGNMTQIIYPGNTSTGWRCAWVYSSELTESYTVSYNANGGTGAPGNQTKVYNVALQLSTTIPNNPGYTFLGWAANNASATTAQYASGGSYTDNAAAVMYAVWKPNNYNITFDANGGLGAPSPQTKIHGTPLKLSTTEPERYGYSFLGWAIDKTATSASYPAGGTFDINAVTTLYAVWSPNPYTITYDANGGTGSMDNSSLVYDQTAPLRSNTFTRDGYSFLGWSINPTDEAFMYADSEAISNLTGTKNDTVTLYAIWEQNAPTHTPGDINGDGSVNNKDLTRLMKYLSGENVEVVELALDVNGDGSVNNKDLTRLMKYLAGEDVTIQ